MKVRREQSIKRTTQRKGAGGTPVAPAPRPKLGLEKIPAERYTSPAYAALEWERMWTKVWLLGCREDEIPEPGDHLATEIGRESVLFVRQSDRSVKAFYNVCQHRGNRLVHDHDKPGEGATTFRCRYHNWSYELNGKFHDIPDLKTFKQGAPPCGGLKEVRCESWGSFIWYSLNPQAAPLRDYLGILPEHLDPYHFERMLPTKSLTVEWNTNWKTSVDAFNESYHVQGTHPQLLYYLDDLDIQIDCYERHSRYLIAFGVLSPRVVSPPDIPPPIKVVMRDAGMDPASYEGSFYDIRSAVQKHKRAHPHGRDYSELNDDQLTDDYVYSVFPNVTMNIHADDLMLFRHRPHPGDPNKMYFDYWMFELPGEEFDHETYKRPVHKAYKDGEVSLGLVINQDAYNMPHVQAGMNSAGFDGLWLGEQEDRLRHFHKTLEDYVSCSNGAARGGAGGKK